MVQVEYSQHYPDGSRLKQVPTEVTIVKREATHKNIAGQVALNVVMLALGGGGGVQGFSKDGLKGAPLEGLTERANVQNPVSTQFVSDLRSKVVVAVQSNAGWRDKSYLEPITVAGGNTSLVYETLADTEEERFRLKTDLVYKRKEVASLWSNANVVVDCQDASPEPLTQSQWAGANYQSVKTQSDAMLAAVRRKCWQTWARCLRTSVILNCGPAPIAFAVNSNSMNAARRVDGRAVGGCRKRVTSEAWLPSLGGRVSYGLFTSRPASCAC
jgi:hypothetical protein